MSNESNLLAAQAQAAINAADDTNANHPGGLWQSAPIGNIDRNYVDYWLNLKQNTLVSGVTIKTLNGVSLLGAGNVSIAGGGAAPGSLISNEVPGGLMNNNNVYFTTANAYLAGSTHLYLNGLRQQFGVHYYESAFKQIMIPDFVQSGDILILDYISA